VIDAKFGRKNTVRSPATTIERILESLDARTVKTDGESKKKNYKEVNDPIISHGNDLD
jgi:hypothetical protein